MGSTSSMSWAERRRAERLAELAEQDPDAHAAAQEQHQALVEAEAEVKRKQKEARVVDVVDKGSHVSYVIEITSAAGDSTEVVTRYSEVELLCATLKKAGIALPPLPRKHMFGSKSSAVTEERKVAINAILEVLCESHGENEDFMKFLDKDKEEEMSHTQMARALDFDIENVKDAFAGELIKYTWEAEGPLGLSFTTHTLNDGTIMAVIHATSSADTAHLIGTVITEINGAPSPNTSQADLLAEIKSLPRPITLSFRKQTDGEASAAARVGEPDAEEADEPRLTQVLDAMDFNKDGYIDEAEFDKAVTSEAGPTHQLVHYLKTKRWLKLEYAEVVKKDAATAAKLDACLDSKALLSFMESCGIDTNAIPQDCYVLQRVVMA